MLKKDRPKGFIMKLIRIRFVLLLSWLAIFYSLERLSESLNVSRSTYTIALIIVIVTQIVPRVVKIPTWLIITAANSLILIYKALTGTLSNEFSLPNIFMELSFISITTLLALWVNKAINEFETTIEHITIGNHNKFPESESQGQVLIYREVRRARNHQRPLSIIKIKVDEKSIEIALDRMIQEAQQAMKKQYALSKVSKILCDKLEDSDVIVQKEDYFLIALPELYPENIPGVIERLRKQVSENVGVNLKIGSASLPSDGLTLEGLLDKATMDLDSEEKQNKLFEAEGLFVNHDSL
jgi:GGDEF domain-containing protein